MSSGACCRGLVDSAPGASFSPTLLRHPALAGWRYDCKSNYMITLVTEPRANLFGTLCEWGVDRSAAGKAVYDDWQEVERDFPGVRATYNAIMPDHFHGILYFTADGAACLDEVVQSFATAVERRLGRRIWCAVYRESICLGRGQLHRQIAYVLSNARRRWVKEHNPGLFRKVLGFRHWRLRRASEACAAAGGADAWDFWRFAREPDSECWEVESGEEIVKPRRSNRRVAAFCEGEYNKSATTSGGNVTPATTSGGNVTPATTSGGNVTPATTSGGNVTPATTSGGGNASVATADGGPACCRGLVVDWTAVGNPFLLDAPLLVSVRISTAVPPGELSRVVAKIREKAARGAAVVSPFVSPGEKAVKTAVLEDGGAVVQLMSEGFGRYYKPGGRDFGFCAEGRLLQLSPFQPRQPGAAERERYGKPRFEWLNLAAANIADVAIGWRRAR